MSLLTRYKTNHCNDTGPFVDGSNKQVNSDHDIVTDRYLLISILHTIAFCENVALFPGRLPLRSLHHIHEL